MKAAFSLPQPRSLTPLHTQPASERRSHPNDFYPTPRVAVEELATREKFSGTVFEPACGDGIVARTLKEHGYAVVGSDILSGVDFLKCQDKHDNIVTNPPYSIATQFLEHALKLARKKVAMLLPLDYLHGIARKPLFENPGFPLSKVIVFSYRLAFGPWDNPPTGHGWFVFRRGWKKPPTIEWV